LTLGEKLQAEDVIVFLESSGIHANGLTMARKIAEKLPEGYVTKLPDGSLYGEALLKPTIIYNSVIQDLFKNKIDLHYISNITGHGWRKVMRHPGKFIYRLDKIPPVPPVLKFMIEQGPISPKEAYGSLNMGAGLAIFVSEKNLKKTLTIAKKNGIKAYQVGRIEKGPKQVIVEPLNITYQGSSLKLRN